MNGLNYLSELDWGLSTDTIVALLYDIEGGGVAVAKPRFPFRPLTISFSLCFSESAAQFNLLSTCNQKMQKAACIHEVCNSNK